MQGWSMSAIQKEYILLKTFVLLSFIIRYLPSPPKLMVHLVFIKILSLRSNKFTMGKLGLYSTVPNL